MPSAAAPGESFRTRSDGEVLLNLGPVSAGTRWHPSSLYTIIWLTRGMCTCSSGSIRHEIPAPALIFSSPYQELGLAGSSFSGMRLGFHGDFYCIERHKKDVSCNGVIFNNVYSPPFVLLDDSSSLKVGSYLELLAADLREEADAGWEDIAISHLKILLVIATRLKNREAQDWEQSIPESQKPLLQHFQKLIEQNFRQWHKPSDYSTALGVSPNALARLSSRHLSKTPSLLILDRIIQEAKRALHFTPMSVKEIAYLLGFSDFGYFGRVFRKRTGISPGEYRKKLGVILLE